MADNFNFELVSPEQLLLSGEAQMVTIPGTEGDMGVLANHAPVMTALRPGLVSAQMVEGEEQTFFVAGGFADITPSGVTVLAEFSLPKSDVTREVFDDQKRLAREAVDAAEDDARKTSAQSYLDQLTNLESTLF